jgi:CRISPR-associated protein Csm1
MSHPPKTEPHRRAHLLAAAGLLHDVGKVGEPADIDLHHTIANLEQQICPSDPHGRPQYRHVLYTAQLLHEVQDQGCDFGGLGSTELFHLAAYHHQRYPDNLEDCLLKKADWLASGHDRREALGEDPRLQVVTGVWPILASLSWPTEQAATGQIMPTETLRFEAAAGLPGPAQDRAAYREGCRRIWSTLCGGIGGTYRDPSDFVERLAAVAHRSMQAVPASREHGQQADVALYDHSRIVAAFAACLAVLHDSVGPSAALRDPRKIEGRYRLVGLGLGAIQRFILRSVPPLDEAPGETGEKGMARRLRARSFFVSLLTWLAARRVLDAAGLPIVNLLFDAGGRAMLLLPDEERLLGRVRGALDYLDQWFGERLGGLLRLDVALSPPLSDAAFTREAFNATFRDADRELAEARLRFPDSELLAGEGWTDDGWIAEQPSLPADRDEFAQSMAELGAALPKASHLTLDCGRQQRIGPRLEILGYEVCLHESRPPGPGPCFALRLDPADPPATPLLLAASHVPVARPEEIDRLAAWAGEGDTRAAEGATQPGELLSFGQLARLAQDEQQRAVGHDMLGALKADVDRLGMLLGYGLGDAASFGRFASVARAVDQFFKGFLDEQLRGSYRDIYTVFAGGDDLFLIGPWYDLVRLLADLHGWFRQITCNNPNTTFSAGLVFSRPTTPVRHLAWLAGEALEAAKDAGRNRLTFGSATMTWPQYHSALDLHRQMRVLATPSDGGGRPELPGAMVYRFLQYATMALRTARLQGPPPPTDLKWRSQLSYDLKRNLPVPDSRDSPLGCLHRALVDIRSADEAAVLHVAATLTLYYLRGEKT